MRYRIWQKLRLPPKGSNSKCKKNSSTCIFTNNNSRRTNIYRVLNTLLGSKSTSAFSESKPSVVPLLVIDSTDDCDVSLRFMVVNVIHVQSGLLKGVRDPLFVIEQSKQKLSAYQSTMMTSYLALQLIQPLHPTLYLRYIILLQSYEVKSSIWRQQLLFYTDKMRLRLIKQTMKRTCTIPKNILVTCIPSDPPAHDPSIPRSF